MINLRASYILCAKHDWNTIVSIRRSTSENIRLPTGAIPFASIPLPAVFSFRCWHDPAYDSKSRISPEKTCQRGRTSGELSGRLKTFFRNVVAMVCTNGRFRFPTLSEKSGVWSLLNKIFSEVGPTILRNVHIVICVFSLTRVTPGLYYLQLFRVWRRKPTWFVIMSFVITQAVFDVVQVAFASIAFGIAVVSSLLFFSYLLVLACLQVALILYRTTVIGYQSLPLLLWHLAFPQLWGFSTVFERIRGISPLWLYENTHPSSFLFQQYITLRDQDIGLRSPAQSSSCLQTTRTIFLSCDSR